jgi:hypothetical protein
MPTERPRAHKDPQLPVPPACEDEVLWLADLRVFDTAEATMLLAAMRTLYPHDELPDPVYRRSVAALDALCRRRGALVSPLRALLSALSSAVPAPFAACSESYRTTALRNAEAAGLPGFRLLQRLTVRFLYDDLAVWQAFGYEGAAYHLGGYVQRGFDDLQLPGDTR